MTQVIYLKIFSVPFRILTAFMIWGYYIVEDMKCTYSPEYTAKFKELFRPDAEMTEMLLLR